MSTKIDWSRQKEQDLWAVAYHEAGHALICEHFNLRWEVNIHKAGRATIGLKAFTGKTAYHPTTHFRRAVLSFAGPIAELMYQETEIHMSRWDFLEVFDDDALSDTDRAGMDCHPQRWRACKLAGHVLKVRNSDLIHIAGIIHRKHWSCSYTWQHDSPDTH